MCLGNILLNGLNFIAWNRSIKMALRAKCKLWFIEGTIPKAGDNSSDLTKWIRCDYSSLLDLEFYEYKFNIEFLAC